MKKPLSATATKLLKSYLKRHPEDFKPSRQDGIWFCIIDHSKASETLWNALRPSYEDRDGIVEVAETGVEDHWHIITKLGITNENAEELAKAFE